MENKFITAFVGLDLSVAFDTVHHEVLLSVLHNCFGIDGAALEWVDSYLRPRSFHVPVAGCNSEEKSVDFSVPQGSVLEPVPFNAYFSTLQSYVAKFNADLCGYADDHCIYKAFNTLDNKNETTIMHEMQHCLTAIHEWLCSNRLKH